MANKSATLDQAKPHAPASDSRRGAQSRSITISGVSPRDNSVHLIALALFGFVLLKGALLFSYGQEGYAGRVEMFQSGTVVEQIGGRLLDIDPVTAALGRLFSAI